MTRRIKHYHPWLQLWTKPRTTFQHILQENPTRWILLFAIISGALDAFIGTSMWAEEARQTGQSVSTLVVLFLLIAGIIAGIVQLYFGGWLLQLTGSWFGGRGNYTEVKCAVGWSMYPMIIAHLVFILSAFFTRHPFVDGAFGLLYLVLSVWAFIILLKVLAEAHQFSAWRALAAVVLAFIMIFVVIMLITLIIPLVSPLFMS